MKLQKLSISQVTQFMTCPRSWYYLYVHNMQLKKNDNLFFGSTIHEALAAFYTGQDPIKALEDYVRKPNKEKPKGITEDEIIADATRLIELYKVKGPYLEPLPGWVEQKKVFCMEHPVTHEILNVPFTIKIDLITRDGYIVDHKTSSKVSKTQTAENRLQGIAYWMFYRKAFGKNPRGFVQNSIVKQKRNPRILQTVFRYTQDDEVYLFETVKNVVGIIERGEYLTCEPLMKTFYKCPIGPLCDIHAVH